jgi:hypothetical protein
MPCRGQFQEGAQAGAESAWQDVQSEVSSEHTQGSPSKGGQRRCVILAGIGAAGLLFAEGLLGPDFHVSWVVLACALLVGSRLMLFAVVFASLNLSPRDLAAID